MFPPRHADPPSDTDACVSLSGAAEAELKDNSEPLRFCEGAQSTGVNIVLDCLLLQTQEVLRTAYLSHLL